MPNTTVGAAPEGLPFDRLPDEAIANLPFDFRQLLLDIFVTNFGTSNTILTNVGEGGFDGNMAPGGIQSSDVALGDFDRDGDLDVIVVNINEPNQILMNNGSGGFGTPVLSGGSANSRAVALGDLDNDGDLDAFVANLGTNHILTNQGGDQNGALGDFVAALELSGGAQSSHGVALGYLNDDEYLDAYVANNGTDQILFNDGNGGFLAPVEVSDADGNSRDVAFGDLNGDGYLDIFVAVGNLTDEPNLVLINDGYGNFTAQPADPDIAFSHAVALGDLNGDGFLDAFIANGIEDLNQVLLNNGDGTFRATTQPFFESGQESFDVSLADLDGDGDLDAYLSNNGYDQILWNNGSGIFTMVTTSEVATVATGVAIGDLNGDGDFAAVNDAGLPNLEVDLLLDA